MICPNHLKCCADSPKGWGLHFTDKILRESLKYEDILKLYEFIGD